MFLKTLSTLIDSQTLKMQEGVSFMLAIKIKGLIIAKCLLKYFFSVKPKIVYETFKQYL